MSEDYYALIEAEDHERDKRVNAILGKFKTTPMSWLTGASDEMLYLFALLNRNLTPLYDLEMALAYFEKRLVP